MKGTTTQMSIRLCYDTHRLVHALIEYIQNNLHDQRLTSWSQMCIIRGVRKKVIDLVVAVEHQYARSCKQLRCDPIEFYQNGSRVNWLAWKTPVAAFILRNPYHRKLFCEIAQQRDFFPQNTAERGYAVRLIIHGSVYSTKARTLRIARCTLYRSCDSPRTILPSTSRH